MTVLEYYNILGLQPDSTIEDIRKAYRRKARQYHPDINNAPDAMDKFIKITEAYDFLIENHDKKPLDDKEFFRIIEEWKKFRQERSRQRANYYARSSYVSFKNSKYYKSTRILNASSIIFNFVVAVMILLFTILGYIIKLKNPLPEDDKPSIFSFILLLTISLILFTVAFFYLKAYIETNKKQRRKK
jgi:hypothetical protein